jgi:hypothetical protein
LMTKSGDEAEERKSKREVDGMIDGFGMDE